MVARVDTKWDKLKGINKKGGKSNTKLFKDEIYKAQKEPWRERERELSLIHI